MNFTNEEEQLSTSGPGWLRGLNYLVYTCRVIRCVDQLPYLQATGICEGKKKTVNNSSLELKGGKKKLNAAPGQKETLLW